MPSLRTDISEIITGLGMSGEEDLDRAVAQRPASLIGVSDDAWHRLVKARDHGEAPHLFLTAWENGRAFLMASEALRHRVPRRIEWKGPTRPVGFEAVPADLRVDHVFLVSCKHRSRVLHNVAPAHIFDRALVTRRGETSGVDWYVETAMVEYQRLYQQARAFVGEQTLPRRVEDLSPEHRARLKTVLPSSMWPDSLRAHYKAFAARVSAASAKRWVAQLSTRSQQEEQLWRLLRHASAPYYLLGATPQAPLRLGIATPWDWRQGFEFQELVVKADVDAGQPVVRWVAYVRNRDSGRDVPVEGFVEVRWSHGKFAGSPEAKVHLVTAHEDVPGYFPLV